MALVDARGFQLVPDVSPLAQKIGQALQQRKEIDRQEALMAQKQKAIQVKDDLLRTASHADRIRDIKDPMAKRTEIAKLAQELVVQGKDASMWTDLLQETNPDQLNLGLTRIFTNTGDAGKMFSQALKEDKEAAQFEPVLDAEGNVVAQRNVQTGQVIADPRAGLKGKERDKKLKDELKATKDKFDQAAKLRGEISKISTDFNKQRGAWDRVQASAEDPSPAGDLALIFNFMKVLDPGSTVREGEFAQVGAAGNLPTQTQRLYEQYATGQKLTDTQRKDVVNRAKRLFAAAEKTNKKDIRKKISIGKEFGIAKKLLLGVEEPKEESDLTPEEQAELDQLRQRFTK